MNITRALHWLAGDYPTQTRSSAFAKLYAMVAQIEFAIGIAPRECTSRPADPYDNALMESGIGTLKTKCADHIFPSRSIARSELFAYLEGW